MRCYICNFSSEENPGSSNRVVIDKKTDKEICLECIESITDALLEFEQPDEQSD